MSRFPLLVLPLLVCASCASAEDTELEKVRAAVTKNLPTIEAGMVTRSAAPGLYQIRRGSQFAYVTADGRFLIQGDMVDIQSGEEITENQRSATRIEALARFGAGESIDFFPKDMKYMVTVFTDIDCGYCRKLHNDMPQYHDAGIGIRYLFYPRSGPNTPSFKKAEAVWCAADRKAALTHAKQGHNPQAPGNCSNPVMEQFAAGEEIGIMATPTLVLPDGELVRGYVQAGPLVARLGQKQGVKTSSLAR